MSAEASVASEPFQGIRIEVDTLVSFDEVLSRLRRLMGDASAQEVVARSVRPQKRSTRNSTP
jgi:hypothetical protein